MSTYTARPRTWYDEFRKDVFWFACAWLILSFFLRSCTPVDDTDRSWDERSGMSLLIDHGTGCQYLQRSGGDLHPRLDKDGTHMCGEL